MAYKPRRTNVPYGLHIPYNQGYDARSRAKAKTAEDQGRSGYLLRPNGAQIDLWVTEVNADFSLSGSTGQSQLVREFFPRSFNDVKLNIKGNVGSTYEYNRLALFIREHQWEALNLIGQGHTGVDPTMTFMLEDHVSDAWQTPDPSWKPPAHSLDVIVPGDVAPGKQTNVKGGHRPWSVQGYVKSVAAGAKRFEVAPEFNLEFIVAESHLDANTGIWSDVLDAPRSLKTMLDLINVERKRDRAQGTGFVADPILEQQKQDVQQGVNSAVWSVAGAISSLKLF